MDGFAGFGVDRDPVTVRDPACLIDVGDPVGSSRPQRSIRHISGGRRRLEMERLGMERLEKMRPEKKEERCRHEWRVPGWFFPKRPPRSRTW
jgi:hypothetical protein